MDRYRIRLKNGRVVGPFKIEDFGELYAKGHILGSEDCQVFPTGDWKPINSFENIRDVIGKTQIVEQNSNREDATYIKKISQLGKNQNNLNKEISENEDIDIDFPQEFKFSTAVDLKLETNNNETSESSEDNPEHKENTEIIEKTVLAKRPVLEENIEKTQINKETLEYLKELKLKQEKENIEKKESQVEQADIPEVNIADESTQMVNLDEIRKIAKSEALKSEEELDKIKKEEDKKKKLEENRKRNNLKKENDEVDEDDEESELEDNRKKRFKMMVTIAALALVYVILFPDEGTKKPKEIIPVYPEIYFPQRFDVSNKEKAKEDYVKGMELYVTHKYNNYLKAIPFLKSSVENQFQDNPAMAKLVMTYSLLLPHSKQKIETGNKIFKLIQINMSSLYKNANMAAAAANFYYNIGKTNASISVIERYNSIPDNKPTLELFSVYLNSLVKAGDMIKAKAVFDKISSAKTKSLHTILSLIEYCLKINDYEQAATILIEAEKIYPNNVALFLVKSGLLLYKEDFKSLVVVLNKIQKLEAEESPVYYAKYLEYRGMIAVKQQQVEKATKFFKKALEINESSELRSRLALLDMGGDDETSNLIAESKALREMATATNHINNGNWKFAFVSAMEATRVAPNFVKAKLFLAQLQSMRSFFEEALKTLEVLFKENPVDRDVNFALINGYIEAYKFNDAKKHMAMIASSDLRLDPMFYKVTAKYYLYKDDFSSAVGWLQQAINKNPLDDELVYDLAKLFIRYNKYSKAKVLLNKAMELDPSKVEYRISYASIIYEVDGAEAAIGYLYDILNNFPDNAKVYSAIGIYYFKSGQLKYFDEIKSKLEKLPQQDVTLYDFLIKAAKIDAKYDDVIKYCNKLIRIDPSDLETRIFLGQVYMEREDYKAALKTFKEVEERLSTYPKLQYYMSKLFLLVDEIDKSIELAKKEIEANPTSELGYILLGDIYRKEEKYIEAEKEYKKAQRIDVKNIDVLLGLAIINFKKNQYEIALDLFNKVKDLDSSRAETYKLLGDVYRKLGQGSMAAKSYKTFLELSPNTKYREQLNNYIRMME